MVGEHEQNELRNFMTPFCISNNYTNPTLVHVPSEDELIRYITWLQQQLGQASKALAEQFTSRTVKAVPRTVMKEQTKKEIRAVYRKRHKVRKAARKSLAVGANVE